MSTNIERLCGKMEELKVSKEDMARKMGIDPSTFYRKLKSKGDNFTVGEMHRIVDVLRLTKEEATSIFLWQYSQKCEKLDG